MANIDYARRLLERPDVRAAREAARWLDDAEDIAAPAQGVEAARRLVEPINTSYPPSIAFSSIDAPVRLARRLSTVLEDFELAMTPIKRLVSILPAPPLMAGFHREAKEAWFRYREGDPEPLDSFIRKYIVRRKNHAAPVPDKIRRDVMAVLDECFAPVLVYAPGDWYFFGPTAQNELIALANVIYKKYPRVSCVPSFEDVLTSAVIIAWDDMQWAEDDSETYRTQTLLNRIDELLTDNADEAPKLLEHAERRPHAFLDEDSDNSVAQFEAREVVQQQVRALPRVLEKAALPPKERMLYGFDSRVGTDFDTIEDAGEVAASALDVSRSTVRTTRFHYRKKLHGAVTSDPRLHEIFEEIAPDP